MYCCNPLPSHWWPSSFSHSCCGNLYTRFAIFCRLPFCLHVDIQSTASPLTTSCLLCHIKTHIQAPLIIHRLPVGSFNYLQAIGLPTCSIFIFIYLVLFFQHLHPRFHSLLYHHIVKDAGGFRSQLMCFNNTSIQYMYIIIDVTFIIIIDILAAVVHTSMNQTGSLNSISSPCQSSPTAPPNRCTSCNSIAIILLPILLMFRWRISEKDKINKDKMQFNRMYIFHFL